MHPFKTLKLAYCRMFGHSYGSWQFITWDPQFGFLKSRWCNRCDHIELLEQSAGLPEILGASAPSAGDKEA